MMPTEGPDETLPEYKVHNRKILFALCSILVLPTWGLIKTKPSNSETQRVFMACPGSHSKSEDSLDSN